MQRKNIGISLIILGLTGWVFYLRRGILWDDEYIVYRYVENILKGNGWCFNVGEPINGCTSALYPILLTLIGFFWIDIPLAGLLVGCVSLGICAYLSYRILEKSGYPLAALTASLLIMVQPIFLRRIGIETNLYLALAAFTILLSLEEKYAWAGLSLGFTVLARPDAVLLGVPLIWAYWLNHRHLPWKTGLYFLIPLLPWALFAFLQFGSPFPQTLSAKMAQGGMIYENIFLKVLPAYLLRPMNLYDMPEGWFKTLALFCFGGVTLAGLTPFLSFSTKRNLKLPGILALWAILHISAYVYMKIPVAYDWHMAAVAWIFCMGAAIGLEKLARVPQKPWGYILASVLLLIFITMSFKIACQQRAYDISLKSRACFYQRAGIWLRENTSPQAKVAASEIGILGYYSQRKIIDRVGLISPDIAQSRKVKDYSWDLRHFRPDYYARFEPLDPKADFLILEPWWNKAYSPLVKFPAPDGKNTFIIYKKTDDTAIPHTLDANFGLIYVSDDDKTGLIQYYLDQGANPDSRCRDGATPLHRAADHGNLDSVKLLLNHHASINAQAKVGSTALMAAITNQHTRVAHYLLQQGADVNLQTDNGWNALMETAKNGDAALAELLLQKGADSNHQIHDGNTPLTVAAFHGNTGVVKALLLQGANPNLPNYTGGTALGAAKAKKFSAIVKLLKQYEAK